MNPEVRETLRIGPFHDALRAAVEARGLPQAELVRILRTQGLHISRATLSSWISGTRHPKLTEVKPARNQATAAQEAKPGAAKASEAKPILLALELLLEIPPQSLVRLASSERRDVDEKSLSPLAAARKNNDGLDLLQFSERVYVHADQRIHTIDTELTVRARKEGCTRYTLVYTPESGASPTTIRIQGIFGCRPGRRAIVGNDQTIAYELIFDRQLAAGVATIVRSRLSTHLPDYVGDAATAAARVFRSKTLYSLSVQFHPAAYPKAVRQIIGRRNGAELTTVADLKISPSHVATAVVPETTTGIHGIVWDW